MPTFRIVGDTPDLTRVLTKMVSQGWTVTALNNRSYDITTADANDTQSKLGQLLVHVNLQRHGTQRD